MSSEVNSAPASDRSIWFMGLDGVKSLRVIRLHGMVPSCMKGKIFLSYGQSLGMCVIIYCIIKRKESSHHGNKNDASSDGTLVNDSRWSWSRLKKAIRAPKDKGILFGLAARREPFFVRLHNRALWLILRSPIIVSIFLQDKGLISFSNWQEESHMTIDYTAIALEITPRNRRWSWRVLAWKSFSANYILYGLHVLYQGFSKGRLVRASKVVLKGCPSGIKKRFATKLPKDRFIRFSY